MVVFSLSNDIRSIVEQLNIMLYLNVLSFSVLSGSGTSVSPSLHVELWEYTEDSSDGVAVLIEILELLDDVLSLLPQAARDSIYTKVIARTKSFFIQSQP
jgi:hypothetical protein